MPEDSDYAKGYAAGHERGATYATRTLADEIARLKADLTWALFQIESPDVPRSIIDEIARLRAAWRLERSGKERQAHGYIAPGGDMETD